MEILVGIIVVGAIVGVSLWTRHRQRTVWQAIAEEFGLQYIDGGFFGVPSMRGTYRGAPITVELEVKRVATGTNTSRRRKVYFTVVESPLSELTPFDLKVYHEGFLQKMGKVIGGQDIQTDDEQIDSAFIIKGTEVDKIKALLTRPEVKRVLLAAHRDCRTLRIDVDCVRIRERGRTTSEATLRRYIRHVLAVANTLNEVCEGRPGSTQQLQSSLAEPAAPATESTVPFGRPAANGQSAAIERAPATDGDDW